MVDQLYENLERKMFDDVECGDSGAALFRQARKCIDRVGKDGIESARTTLFDSNAIQVVTARRYSRLCQEFQPFPATATNIDDGAAIGRRNAFYDLLKIDALSAFDVVPRTAIAIFK